MNTMKMTLKWEMRKRFEGCKIFLLVLAIIIAVHSILPLPKRGGHRRDSDTFHPGILPH